MTDFLPIDKDNVHLYCDFAKVFETDLKKFQSRIYPENSDFFIPLKERGQLSWDYILYDDEIIGAIWLERDHPELPVAKLGVFIAQKKKRSKGIGRQAVTRYIKNHKTDMSLKRVTLNVRKENIRRVTCYKKCGFVIEKEYEKEPGLKVYAMRKEL